MALIPKFTSHETHANMELAKALNDAFALLAGGGIPAINVLASDSYFIDSIQSRFVADGVADQNTINDAIDALPATGGMIILSDGNFNLSGPINIDIAHGFYLKGMGKSTKINCLTGMNDYAIKFVPGAAGIWANLADFEIYANGHLQTAGGGIYAYGAIQSVFQNIYINKPYDNGIYVYRDGTGGGTGHHNRIITCLVDEGEQSNGGDGRGIKFEASDENWIITSDFESNGRAAASEPNHIYDRSGLQHIIGCNFVGGQTGVKLEQRGSRVIGCMFDGCRNHHVRLNGNANIVADNWMLNVGFGSSGNDVDGIWVDNVTQNKIHGNIIDTYNGSNGARSGINFANGATDNDANNNSIFQSGNAWGSARIIAGTGNRIRNNPGFLTENGGTATVANGATTAVVNHGLAVTPSAANIHVTPTNNMGNAAKFFIGTITSTQFTITVDADPGAGTATFSWQASVL